MPAEAGPHVLHLGDEAGDLLDAVHLLPEVLSLQEVAEVGVTVRGLVQVQQALVDLKLDLFYCSKFNAIFFLNSNQGSITCITKGTSIFS